MNTTLDTPAELQTKSPLELEDKVVLVTGGGGGLGAALCAALADAGARIAVGDARHDAVQQVVENLCVEHDADRIQPLVFDVGNPSQAENAVLDTLERFGRIDVLINNAGTDKTCALDDLDYDDWDRVVRTNLYGPFLLSKVVMPHMRRQGGGHIVNIASTAAKRAWPNASAYHASKWGLLGLSHALHAELRPHNIKVTAVICGGMRTPFLLERFPDLDPGLLQEPANVARAIVAVLTLPEETVVPEISVLPMRETSWP